jgi:hypothetical protein
MTVDGTFWMPHRFAHSIVAFPGKAAASPALPFCRSICREMRHLCRISALQFTPASVNQLSQSCNTTTFGLTTSVGSFW